MPVTELYAFNLTCVILLAALYGVALKDKLYSAETIAEQTDKQLSKALADNEKLTDEINRLKSDLSEKNKEINELSEKFETERHTSEQTIRELEKSIAGLSNENKLLTEKLEAVPKFFRKNQ